MNSTFNVLIEDIENAQDKTLEYDFNERIEEFDAQVSAELTLKSLGEFIEVTGQLNTVLKLECDRCLSEFDYEMQIDIDEMFAKHALSDDYGQETEIKDGQFITDLNGENEINIYDLLYQSVILNLPNKKVCGINCNEGFFDSDENFKVEDPRMDVFKNIKIQPK